MRTPVYSILKNQLTDFLSAADTKIIRNKVLGRAVFINSANDKFIYLIHSHILFTLKELKASSESQQAALLRIGEINLVKSLCDELEMLIIKEAQIHESYYKATGEHKNIDDVNLSIDLTAERKEQLLQTLTQWTYTEYGPHDERIEIYNDSRMRRFDSLSQVLIASTKGSLSICGAVTIEMNQGQPQLIISANLPSNKFEAELLQEISFKLKVLKGFFSKYYFNPQELPPEAQCEQLAEQLYNSLYINFSNEEESAIKIDSLPSKREQAVYKLTHSLFYEDINFSAEEKNAFLAGSTAIVLTPLAPNDEAIQLKINSYTADDQYGFSYHQLKHNIPAHQMKYIHAEQLLALYLYEVRSNPKETPFIIGISKLCCYSCSEFLKDYPAIKFRGTHQKKYPGVIDLATGKRLEAFAQRPGPLCAKASPFKTPQKKREDVEKVSPNAETVLPKFAHNESGFRTPPRSRASAAAASAACVSANSSDDESSKRKPTHAYSAAFFLASALSKDSDFSRRLEALALIKDKANGAVNQS